MCSTFHAAPSAPPTPIAPAGRRGLQPGGKRGRTVWTGTAAGGTARGELPMPPKRSSLRRLLLRICAVSCLANVVFFALMLLVQPHPATILARAEFHASGAVVLQPHLARNDCVVLQMLLNPASSRLKRALAPAVYYREGWRHPCDVLRDMVEQGLKPDTVTSGTIVGEGYARYWHGYNVVTALALRVMEVQHFRWLLLACVGLALGLLALATAHGGARTRRTGLMIAVTAGTLWAVPRFAREFTFGPGDAFLIAALAVIPAWPRIAVSLETLVLFGATYGATVVFFEMLTGQLPVAFAWLGALTLAAARDEHQPAGMAAAVSVGTALGAFCLSAVLTVLIKQCLAFTLAEPQAAAAFLGHLQLYSGLPTAEGSPATSLMAPFVRMLRETHVLTAGYAAAGYGLMAATAIGWMAAAGMAWRQRRNVNGQDRAILLALSLVPVGWVCSCPRTRCFTPGSWYGS